MSSFLLLDIAKGYLHEHDDGNFRTVLTGFLHGSNLELPACFTHFGFIFTGTVHISAGQRERKLFAGDYFSLAGASSLAAEGEGLVISAFNYHGMNVYGGPVEGVGRLRYIDGCSDTLLIPPVRIGDPCLNHLHFPSNITQTPHTHPSVRAGLIYRGQGECIVPDLGTIPLIAGRVFVIPRDVVHSFNTASDCMDVIAFHPDSDVGMTDDNHPMINRTIIGGVSARSLPSIMTAAIGVPKE